ncbi:MAG: energy transducer TonB [Rhodanobacter sp.]
MPHLPSAVSRRYGLTITSFLILALLGVGILWYGHDVVYAASIDAGALPSRVPVPVDDAQSGTRILLNLARDAMREGRLVAPAGSNAYEFYLSVLQLDPANETARDTLRESFPRAAWLIERDINAMRLDEARRELDLLHEFDGNNFTLALLGGKLSAARSIVMKQHEAKARQIQEAATRPQPRL